MYPKITEEKVSLTYPLLHVENSSQASCTFWDKIDRNAEKGLKIPQ